MKGAVSLVVYNVLGQKIKTLLSNELNSGKYTVHWMGDNVNRQKVSTGIYIIQLNYSNQIITKRMELLR